MRYPYVGGIENRNMKKLLILLTVISVLSGCSNKKLSPSEAVEEYYAAFDSSNFERLISLVDDSLTIVEGEFLSTYNHDSFYQQFKWDSIFQPTYEVIRIEEESDHVIATVSSHSLRYEFLKNNPLTSKFKISLNSGKISRIELVGYEGADFEVWQKERDSLVKWVNTNHPELDGFVNDLTINGSKNYLKAIELYENRKDAL